MLRRLWHRVVCIPFNRSALRETVGGVLGFRCPCGLWRPVVARYQDELMSAVPRPSHEQLKAKRQKFSIVKKRA